jgi:hypothetical protein
MEVYHISKYINKMNSINNNQSINQSNNNNLIGAGAGSTQEVNNNGETEKKVLHEKYEIMIRPAQSGKTRKMQELIKDYEKSSNDKSYINILICSRNLNLVKQTQARMKKDLYDQDDEDDESDNGSADDSIDKEGIFSWMTGTKKNNISVKELKSDIIDDNVDMVICCSHKKRIRYVKDLLNLLDASKHFDKKINMWFDEFDDYVNLWAPANFHENKKVNKIHLVSATIDAVMELYDLVKVIPYQETYPECYHKFMDSQLIEVESSSSNTVDYLKEVYTKFKALIKKPNIKLFAPGDDEVKSHDHIADYLLGEGFAVAIINGKRKCIITPDDKENPLYIEQHVEEGEIMEIGKVIAKMYKQYDLARYPFAITGKLCLSRGITFQVQETHESIVATNGVLSTVTKLDFDFIFDVGIIPDMRNNATLYQCVSRTQGNTCNFINYKPPVLFMTSTSRKRIQNTEKIAMNLAKLVEEHGLEYVGKDEINWAIHGDKEKYNTAKENGDLNDILIQGPMPTVIEAKLWSENMLTQKASLLKPCDEEGKHNENDTHFHYRGILRPIETYSQTLASGDLSYGLGSYNVEKNEASKTGQPRIMPVLVNNQLQYIVIYKRYNKK